MIFSFFKAVMNCYGGWEDAENQYLILSSQDATVRYCLSYRKPVNHLPQTIAQAYRRNKSFLNPHVSSYPAVSYLAAGFASVPVGEGNQQAPLLPKHLSVFLSTKNCHRHPHGLITFELINQGTINGSG